jgi:hypothetical protein
VEWFTCIAEDRAAIAALAAVDAVDSSAIFVD